ncbi:glycosyltransferase family 2 protein [Pseudalkalibacillus salsuginis]|uniref:glycosyltransferase family 2 protein n=1 Tax=Pseudalkalibacillus salsuginis TaxID=2910972 RepID=UPI001F215AB7|nr:glycosyltransferase family 2 protein [Pseudalkalibacillus salsuginis]MCF6409757.1 glycosyltransferase family 2 protein [Pseudalkalibacillus salsuginis]
MSIDRPMELLSLFFGNVIIIYMVVVILSYTVMLTIAFLHIRKDYQLDKDGIDEGNLNAALMKPVTIIVPAYNEEAGVLDTIHSLLSLRFPQTEIIIVNDGSTDDTQQKLISEFHMNRVEKVVRKEIPTEPIRHIYQSNVNQNLWLIEKENGGKADALNAGINLARYPYFCSIDGDSILNEKSLLRVMNPIVSSNDEVIAVGGNVRIANGHHVKLGSVFEANLSKNHLVVMQVIEYLRAFMMGRISLSKFNLVLIISGAFSVFSKKWVVEVGGYSKHTMGEDMELVVKLHRLLKEKKLKKQIQFVPDPVCWTEAPQSYAVLRRQRRRWHQGLVESLWKHKKMTFNPKYGAIGMISFPYFWLVECLGPLIELGGYVYIIIAFFFGGMYYEFAILLTLLFILYGAVFSTASVLLDAWSKDIYPRTSDVVHLIFMSLTEVFWFRPLTLLWRLEGFFHFLLRRKEWGNMQRAGFTKKGSSL